ncbi:MAG: serine protease, partial [Rhodothermia bacterium]|nr:serine protease [Rhodothermia bacterium]
ADQLEIISIDRRADLVIVGQELGEGDVRVPPLQLATGEMDDLQWGSFVYVLGYPAGVKMVTRGLTSRPVADNRKSFVIDATFNNGFSGGAVLAIRGGIPNLEWVGVATSSAARTEWALMPSVSEGDVGLDPGRPFRGDIYAVQKKSLRYGITICVSSDAVVQFLDRHREALHSQGFRVELP